MNGLGYDVMIISLLFNALILIALNYKKLNILSLFSFYYILVSIYNFTAIAVFDIIIISNLIREINIHKLAFINVMMITMFIGCLYFMSMMGIINSEEWISSKGTATSLGLNNPNALGIWFYYLIVNMRLSLIKRPNFMFFVVIVIITYFAFGLSYSRTTLLGSLIFIILVFLNDRKGIKLNNKIIEYSPLLLFSLILLVTFVIAKALPEIDLVFSYRFSIYLKLLSDMSVSDIFMGYRVPEGQAMDNAFLMLLFEGGSISIFLLIVYFRKMTQRYTSSYMPFLLSMLLVGLAENTFSVPSTTSILFWSMILYKREDCIDKVIISRNKKRYLTSHFSNNLILN